MLGGLFVYCIWPLSDEYDQIIPTQSRWVLGVKLLVNYVFFQTWIFMLLTNIWFECFRTFNHPCPSFRLLVVTSSRSVRDLAPVLASTSPWWWWNPSWWRCCPSTLCVLTKAWPWTASIRPITSPSSLWSISRRPSSSAWHSYPDREEAGRHSETYTLNLYL